MSRSGYSDDCDGWALIRWRGAVGSAIRGKRGQTTLREIRDALDAMPEKSLAAGSLVTPEGEFCTLGVLGAKRGLDLSPIDPDDRESVAKTFGIAEALAAEIMYLNDEYISDWKWVDVEICGPVRPCHPEWGGHKRSISLPDTQTGNKRWSYMRNWVNQQIKDTGVIQ